MKIHFCDLCNESVPEGDLKTGKAFLRKGRVVCAACEGTMRGAEEEAARAASAPPPTGVDGSAKAAKPASQHASQHVPRDSAAPPQASSGGKSGGRLVGMLALVLVLGLGAYVGNELEQLRGQQDRSQGRLEGRLRQLGGDLDDLGRRARDRDHGLEVQLDAGLQQAGSEARAQMETLRAALALEVARLDQVQADIVVLRTGLRESDEDNGKRLDELMAQAMKSRDRLDGFDGRLRGAELALASGLSSAPQAPVAAAAAPARFGAELADLASDNAGTRWNAVQALGETGDPAVIPHLVPVLKDVDVFVRMAVARVMGDLAAPEAIEPLINALEDEEAVVREASMVALHGITGRNFRFDPVASAAERAKKVKAWRSWWKKAREEYFGEA